MARVGQVRPLLLATSPVIPHSWSALSLRCEHRDLILTRSAYDHKRVRPLKPMVGGGQISGVLSPRTGGAGSSAKSSIFLEEKPPSVVESYKTTTHRHKADISGLDVRC